VNRVGQQALEEGLVVEGEVERFDEVAEAVRRLVLRSGTLCSSLTATSAAIPLVRENRPSVCTP
jgi:Tfp pilus assembly PilM family ATPase